MTPKEILEKIDKNGWINYFEDNDLMADIINMSPNNIWLIEAVDELENARITYCYYTGKIYDYLEKEVYNVG